MITSAADYLSNSISTERAATKTLASTLVENELVSSSVSVGEAMPLNDIFGSSSEAAQQTEATSVPSSSSSVQPQPQSQSQSPLSMSHLVREQGSKIRELETVNVDLVGELDRVSRTKDQLIASLQNEVQKLRTNSREKELKTQVVQDKADQVDLIQVERESLKREVEDLRYERDSLLVRLEKSATEALSARNELRNVKLELNTSTLEIGRLKLELESSSSEMSNLKPAMEGASSEKQLLFEQLQKERKDLARALDNLSQAETREALMQQEITSLRRKVLDAEALERELLSARRKLDSLDAELRDVSAENAMLRARSDVGKRSYEQLPQPPSLSVLAASPAPAPAPTLRTSPFARPPAFPVQGPARSLLQQAPSPPRVPESAVVAPAPAAAPAPVLASAPTPAPAVAVVPPPASPKVNRTRVLSMEEKNAPSSGSFLSDFSGRIPTPAPAAASKPSQPAPFATESSSAALVLAYEATEKVLTTLISEKTSLREEGARCVRSVQAFLSLFYLYFSSDPSSIVSQTIPQASPEGRQDSQGEDETHAGGDAAHRGGEGNRTTSSPAHIETAMKTFFFLSYDGTVTRLAIRDDFLPTVFVLNLSQNTQDFW